MESDALSPDDVYGKLVGLGYKEEADLFKQNEIDGSVLEYITEDHLIEMGIKLVGPRVVILDFIGQLIDGTKKQQKIPTFETNTRKDLNKTVPLKALPKVPVQQQRVKIANPKAGNSRPTTAKPVVSTKMVDGEKPKYVRDHEKIVESMRAARKYAAYEKAFAKGRAVGPPPELPPIEEPEGLAQCPSCGRKMYEEASKHHFPVCARTFSQGNMTKKRR